MTRLPRQSLCQRSLRTRQQVACSDPLTLRWRCNQREENSSFAILPVFAEATTQWGAKSGFCSDTSVLSGRRPSKFFRGVPAGNTADSARAVGRGDSQQTAVEALDAPVSDSAQVGARPWPSTA